MGLYTWPPRLQVIAYWHDSAFYLPLQNVELRNLKNGDPDLHQFVFHRCQLFHGALLTFAYRNEVFGRFLQNRKELELETSTPFCREADREPAFPPVGQPERRQRT